MWPVAGLEEGIRTSVEHEVDALRLTGGQHGLHQRHRLGQRLHLVLDVGTHRADADGLAHGLAGIAVARLEVSSDGQVGRGDDPSHGIDHQVDRDVLAILVAVGRGHRVAGRGEGCGALDLGDDLGADRVPDVDDGEQLGVGVEGEELLGLCGDVGHAATVRPSTHDRISRRPGPRRARSGRRGVPAGHTPAVRPAPR